MKVLVMSRKKVVWMTLGKIKKYPVVRILIKARRAEKSVGRTLDSEFWSITDRGYEDIQK